MKKLLNIMLAVFMAISNTCVVFANEQVELYAYTGDTSGFDEYASENLSNFIYGHYGYVDDTIELGKGITVEQNDNIPKVLYPIWKNTDVIATFTVIYLDDEYSGTYLDGFTSQLNAILNMATIDNPLRLVAENNTLYAKVGNMVYDLNGTPGEFVNYEIINERTNDYIVNARISINYSDYIISRAPTTYMLSWTEYHKNTSDEVNCGVYCLSNTLRNMGLSRYTYTYVKDYFESEIFGLNSEEGSYSGIIEVYHIEDFLDDFEFSYYSASTGYFSQSTVQQYIYNYRKPIILGLTYSGSSEHHFAVLYGYSDSTYTVWDPRSTASSHTMSVSTRKFTNSRMETFIWNAGVIANIR